MPEPEIGVLRILDAAANRAGEGLRVIEDFLRFVLDDRYLTSHCKDLRHDLAGVIATLPDPIRHAARDTLADVGTRIDAEQERLRTDTAAVVAASFKRVGQALRSLEEYGKLVHPSLGADFEQLRYRVYTLERAVDLTRSSMARLADARLCVLIDGRSSSDEFTALVQLLVEAGVDMLQLRDKRLNDRELLERARQLRELTRDTKTIAIVNDRSDIARRADADGVHVGQEDLAVKEARSTVGASAIIGVSTHSLEQARQAVLDGANYVGVGPTFPSRTKQFNTFPGLELLRSVAAEIRLPAFAIGGITLENVADVIATGIRRVAVGGAILDADDPAAASREFVQRLEKKDL